MNAKEKYLNWLEGYLRETVDSALEKAFTDFQIGGGYAKDALMILIDAYIKNQLDISEKKRG